MYMATLKILFVGVKMTVKLIGFLKEGEKSSEELKEILEKVEGNEVRLEFYDFESDEEKVKEYGIERTHQSIRGKGGAQDNNQRHGSSYPADSRGRVPTGPLQDDSSHERA
jgi:hypothetical protein